MGVPKEYWAQFAGLDEASQSLDPFPYPLLVSPRDPYVSGRVALVFLSPHAIDAAGDRAEFGWGTESYETPDLWTHGPPYEGACVMAWFRHWFTEAKFNVNFVCEGQPGHSFILESESGLKETVDVPTLTPVETLPLKEASAGRTFTWNGTDWTWFKLSMDAHWKLLSFEVDKLPG
jgi:hypothetical protein